MQIDDFWERAQKKSNLLWFKDKYEWRLKWNEL